MRIGIISDVHANLPALEAVLARLDERRVERIHSLGDTVGYGPFPNECVELVRQRCTVVLKGNHDSGLTGETDIEDFNQYGLTALLWTRGRITPANEEFLRSLPLVASEGDLTFAHASPLHPEDWPYLLTLRAARAGFGAFSTKRCFVGHTHIPLIISEDLSVGEYRMTERTIINVGSVGQPRDGVSDAAAAIYDTESQDLELIRVPYDVQRTADAIAAAGLPEYLGRRLFQGM